MLRKKHLALAVSTVLCVGTMTARAEVVVEQLPLTGSTPAPTQPAGVQTQAVPKPAAIDATPLDTAAGGNPNGSAASASGASGGGNSAWELYQQVQQLQDQVQQMQGTIEEQGHTIERLQKDQKAQYKDLDQRVNTLNDKVGQLQQAPTPAPAANSAAGPAPADGSTAMPVSNIEEEKNAYLSAYNIFRTQGPDQAIPPMLTFVSRYPKSTFAPNAYYWLGEFYLAASTPDLASSERNFQTVLSQYPDNPKAPAALYKLGMIADQQGKADLAKKRMQDVLSRFPSSPEATLASNYLKPAPAPEAKAKPDVKSDAKNKAKAKAKKKKPAQDD